MQLWSGSREQKGLAVTVDCNGKYVYADPFKGTMMAVSEAARNIVCSGGPCSHHQLPELWKPV